MEAINYIAVAAGVFGLSAVSAHLAWERIRIARLRADLCRIQIELREKAASLGCLQDPEYRQVTMMYDAVIGRPEFFINWSWIVAVYFNSIPVVEGPRTANPELRAAIDRAMQVNSLRMAGHLFHETLMGAFIRACLPSIVRGKAERKVEEPVKQYLGDLPSFPVGQAYASWRSCCAAN